MHVYTRPSPILIKPQQIGPSSKSSKSIRKETSYEHEYERNWQGTCKVYQIRGTLHKYPIGRDHSEKPACRCLSNDSVGGPPSLLLLELWLQTMFAQDSSFSPNIRKKATGSIRHRLDSFRTLAKEHFGQPSTRLKSSKQVSFVQVRLGG